MGYQCIYKFVNLHMVDTRMILCSSITVDARLAGYHWSSHWLQLFVGRAKSTVAMPGPQFHPYKLMHSDNGSSMDTGLPIRNMLSDQS